MKHGRPFKLVCPCCGAPGLTQSEVQTLFALADSRAPLGLDAIAKAADVSTRGLRRMISLRDDLLSRRHDGKRYLYSLSIFGRKTVERLRTKEAAE